jgi:hypothetical protein
VLRLIDVPWAPCSGDSIVLGGSGLHSHFGVFYSAVDGNSGLNANGLFDRGDPYGVRAGVVPQYPLLSSLSPLSRLSMTVRLSSVATCLCVRSSITAAQRRTETACAKLSSS